MVLPKATRCFLREIEQSQFFLREDLGITENPLQLFIGHTSSKMVDHGLTIILSAIIKERKQIPAEQEKKYSYII